MGQVAEGSLAEVRDQTPPTQADTGFISRRNDTHAETTHGVYS